MTEPEFRLIQPNDYQAFDRLIENNRERLKRYFPITINKTQNTLKVRAYLQEWSQLLNKKELFPFGLFQEEEIFAVVLIKNIDWKIGKAELGYYIDADQEGRGITTLLVNNTITYCFEELELQKVFLRIAPDNLASIKVAEKTGFIKEGILRREFKIETGELVDMVYYGKLRDADLL